MEFYLKTTYIELAVNMKLQKETWPKTFYTIPKKVGLPVLAII